MTVSSFCQTYLLLRQLWNSCLPELIGWQGHILSVFGLCWWSRNLDVVFIHLRHDIVSEQQLCLLKSAIWYLPVVALLRTKPIRRNKFCAQEDDSRSIYSIYLGLRDINAFAVLVAIDLEITLPRLLDAMIYFWTIASIFFPSRSGHAVGFFGIRGSRIVSFCFDLVSSDCFFFFAKNVEPCFDLALKIDSWI